jgi:hypothetical protein
VGRACLILRKNWMKMLAIYGETDPKYWTQYTNLQYVKHTLNRNYLNGWLPRLGSWSGRILYFDINKRLSLKMDLKDKAEAILPLFE